MKKYVKDRARECVRAGDAARGRERGGMKGKVIGRAESGEGYGARRGKMGSGKDILGGGSQYKTVICEMKIIYSRCII